jgi:exoribonuclease II
MSNHSNRTYNLNQIALEAMADHGFEAEFSKAAIEQADALRERVRDSSDGFEDLTSLPWCSIDNDDSRDLDQVSVSEDMPSGGTKVLDSGV